MPFKLAAFVASSMRSLRNEILGFIARVSGFAGGRPAFLFVVFLVIFFEVNRPKIASFAPVSKQYNWEFYWAIKLKVDLPI